MPVAVGIPVAADHGGGKAVPPPHHGFYETRLLWIVPQDHADLADCRVNTVINIKEDILAPEALGDLLAGYQPAAPFDQQDEQLHGEFFQAQEALPPLKPILGLVECEIAELEFLGRKSSAHRP